MKLHLKKISAGAVGAAVLLIAAAVVFAQQPQGPRPGPPPVGFRGGPDGPGGPPDGFGQRGPGGPPEGFGPRGPGGPREGFGPFGPFGRDLNLTDDQRTAIQKIGESFRESDRALLDQMRTLHESQRDFSVGDFDEAAIRAAAEARAKIQIELEVSHARMMSQMFGVLTAEQKAQLTARRQEMQQRRSAQPPQ